MSPQTDATSAELMPCLVRHAHAINEMDTLVNEQYMFGDSASASWVSPWQPSEVQVVDEASALANITAHDCVMDLGCGDGRVLIRLASTVGCQVIGWDCAAKAIEVANTLATDQARRCVFRNVDFTLPLSEDALGDLQRVTVVFVYLVHYGLQKIEPLLRRMCNGKQLVRIITNTYHLPESEWRIVARNQADSLRVVVSREEEEGS
jgi:SAM-dependent methyltransferase